MIKLQDNDNSGRAQEPSKNKDGLTTVRSFAALESSLRETVFLQKTNTRLISLQVYQLILNVALLLVTVVVLAVLLNRPIKNQYFIVDEQGRIITQMNLLADPMLSSNKARTFADDCIRMVLNIDFVHYKAQLANAESCFTRKGFVQFMGLLQEQGVLAELSEGYNVGSVIPKQANFVKSTANVRGQLRWQIKGAYIWSLQQGKKTIQYPLNIEAILVETSINQSVHGMVIEALTITRA
jgi:hypothetical protein